MVDDYNLSIISSIEFPPDHLLTKLPSASTCTNVCCEVTQYFFLSSVDESKSVFKTVSPSGTFAADMFLSADTQLGHHAAWKNNTVVSVCQTNELS